MDIVRENDRDGTSYGSMTSGDQVAGQIDGSLDFEGTDDYIQWSSAIAQTTGTYSWWMYAHSVTGERNYIANGAYRERVSLWDDIVKVETDTDAEYFEYDQSSISANTWTHIVFVRVGNTGDLYIDGSWVQQVVVPGADTLTVSCIGGTSEETRMVDGVMDEVRISNTTRSVDWIATEYNNQYDPSSFYTVGSEDVLDITPPVINNFGVEDLGTGTGTFWADIIDAHSSVDSALLKINGTDEYSMSSNGTHWIKQLSVNFTGYYEYQIVNASDIFGNYLTIPSSNKSYTFNFDTVAPDVLDWEYYDDTGLYGTFKANVSDSWGVIDTVIVNVTEGTILAGESWAIMWVNASGYLNDTIEMDTGTIKFTITVNDTAGNSFTSSEHQGYVFFNQYSVITPCI
jgi:hypothetical protein